MREVNGAEVKCETKRALLPVGCIQLWISGVLMWNLARRVGQARRSRPEEDEVDKAEAEVAAEDMAGKGEDGCQSVGDAASDSPASDCSR